MSEEKIFRSGDWVTIKYGEYNGSYGKLSMRDKDGRYVVLPYNADGEPQALITLDAEALELIEPYVVTRKQLRAFVRAGVLYRDLKDQVFPPFNVRAASRYTMKAEDIREALSVLMKAEDSLELFKEWFWILNNIFYDKLKIKERYREEYFSDDPENDDDIFSVVFGMTEDLYWKLEDRFSQRETVDQYLIRFDDPVDWGGESVQTRKFEKNAFDTVCRDIISRVDAYESNKDLPRKQWTHSYSQKRHMVLSYENEEKRKGMGEEEIVTYRKNVADLYMGGDIEALKILAWGCYEGNEFYSQNWFLAERYLLELLDRTGDPLAANSLGYIYYYGRTRHGVPNYEKAYQYFSFGALAGIDESIYKVGDMIIRGQGTKKNIDVGLNLIIDGYRNALAEFCEGNYDNKFADYALRMGNACRDELIYGMGLRDAYKFYLEAQLAIRMRRRMHEEYGDDRVEKNIEIEIAHIRENLNLDSKRTSLRMNFPIYLGQLFDDKYPIKVELKVNKRTQSGTLRVSRFRLGSELADRGLFEGQEEFMKLITPPQLLVSYPELSWAELVSGITYQLEKVVVAQKPEKGSYFLSDGYRKNEKTDALEFYAGGEMVAAIDAQWYVVEVKKEQK